MKFRSVPAVVGMLLSGPSTIAQVNGTVGLIPQGPLALEVTYSYYSHRFAPLCDGERVFVLEKEMDKKAVSGQRCILQSYDLANGTYLSGHEVPLHVGTDEKLQSIDFFLAGSKPAILYTGWNEDSNAVTLHVVGFEAETLQQITEPLVVGRIPFSVGSYLGGSVGLVVSASPSGEYVLFRTSRLRSAGKPVLLCWVMDSDLHLEWSGAHVIPVYAEFASTQAKVSDDGTVYASFDAIPFSTEEMSLKTKLGWAQEIRGMLVSIQGQEPAIWDGGQLAPSTIHAVEMDIVGDQPYFAADLTMPGREDGKHEWVVGTVTDDLEPLVEVRLPAPADKDGPGKLRDLVMLEEGGGFLIGQSGDSILVFAFDRQWRALWRTAMAWDGRYVANAFTLNGQLRLCLSGSSLADWGKTQKVKIPAIKKVPVPNMITFGTEGKPHVQDLIGPKELGGKQEFMSDCDFRGMRRCGRFIDYSRDPDKPGVLIVPVR